MLDNKCVHGAPLTEPCLFCDKTENKLHGDGGVPEPAPRQVIQPTAFLEDVAVFVQFMQLEAQWLKADIILQRLTGRLSKQFNNKAGATTYLRHMAKASRGLVISGQRGYKATIRANVEEVQASAAGLMKAALGCMDRRSDILFVFHNGRTKTQEERGQGGQKYTVTAEEK